jgi:cobyrinic acid a,c-diamide synthase
MSKSDMLNTFQRASLDADIAIIEGVMGIYDSLDSTSDVGSTSSVAKTLKTPTILVVSGERKARSIAAEVLGYLSFDRDVRFEGIIINKVDGQRHVTKVREAIQSHVKVPVLGCLPRDEDISISCRHLGLVPAVEEEGAKRTVSKLADFMERHVDLQKLFKIARRAPSLPDVLSVEQRQVAKGGFKVGVLYDKAFSLYYADNLDALREQGAEVKLIDAFKDQALPPELDGLYIGGGFPELYAEQLETNDGLRKAVLEFAERGKPIYAECGGLMFLSKRMISSEGLSYEMVGFFDADVIMLKKRQAHGYVQASVIHDNLISNRGDVIRGHEYHHSKLILHEKPKLAYKLLRGVGVDGEHDGLMKQRVLASYLHVHVASHPKLFENFQEACLKRN